MQKKIPHVTIYAERRTIKMKKLLAATLLLTTLGISNLAMADTKIAVVDIQALVNKSSQVQALKKDNEAKAKDLQKQLIQI